VTCSYAITSPENFPDPSDGVIDLADVEHQSVRRVELKEAEEGEPEALKFLRALQELWQSDAFQRGAESYGNNLFPFLWRQELEPFCVIRLKANPNLP